MKINVPITAPFQFDSSLEEWTLLAEGKLEKIEMNCIFINLDQIEFEYKVVINSVLFPADINNISIINNSEFTADLKRIYNHLIKLIINNNWVLFGYIDWKEKIPITITYNQIFDTAVYTIGLQNDFEESKLIRYPYEEN